MINFLLGENTVLLVKLEPSDHFYTVFLELRRIVVCRLLLNAHRLADVVVPLNTLDVGMTFYILLLHK